MTERNNDGRFAVPEDAPQISIPQPQSPTIQQSSLNFVSPTEIVNLPSKGNFYPEGHPLRGKKDIEIKFMTAKEEDILTSKSLLKKGLAIDKLLESLIVDKNIKIDDLVLGDKNALLIASRITGYGPGYETSIKCPACDTKAKHTFDLNEILSKEIPEPENLVSTGRGTFIIKLPKTQADVEVRPMFGRDEKHLSSIQENKVKMKLPESLATTQMKMFIVSINGITDRGQLDRFIDQMPASDSRFLRISYKEAIPDIEMKQQFVCSKCDYEQEMEVPLTAEFFWPDN